MSTPSTATPDYLRPIECPSRKQSCPTEKCGLLTISASQLGAVSGLILGACLYLAQILGGSRRESTAVPEWPQGEDQTLGELFWAILLLSALYYAVAEWVLEERDYIKLRELRFARFEFWLRVALGVMFGLAVAGVPKSMRLGLNYLHASFFVLCIIYLGFLFWDLIVASGGGEALVNRVIVSDFAGLLLVLGCLWTHAAMPLLAPLVIVGVLIFIVVKLAHIASQFEMKRIWKRELQR